MAELTWTAEAERWLHDIYDYIAQDNLPPPSAQSKHSTKRPKSSESFRNQATATGKTRADTSVFSFMGTIELLI
jgi:hypothetical protein